MLQYRRAAAVAGILVAACGCRGSDVTTDLGVDDCLVLPVVSPASATLRVGDTLHLTASTKICLGKIDTNLAPYSWTSSDSTVATVSTTSGLVLAIREGRVTIAAASVNEPLVKGAMALTITP
jgi:hypothetical protein